MKLLGDSVLEMLETVASPFGNWRQLLYDWKQRMPELERRAIALRNGGTRKKGHARSSRKRSTRKRSSRKTRQN
jgi:hypothetical protein